MKEFTRSDMMYEMLLTFYRDSLQKEIILNLSLTEFSTFKSIFEELNFNKGESVKDDKKKSVKDDIGNRLYEYTITKK